MLAHFFFRPKRPQKFQNDFSRLDLAYASYAWFSSAAAETVNAACVLSHMCHAAVLRTTLLVLHEENQVTVITFRTIVKLSRPRSDDNSAAVGHRARREMNLFSEKQATRKQRNVMSVR
jgi:hypothetical protein